MALIAPKRIARAVIDFAACNAIFFSHFAQTAPIAPRSLALASRSFDRLPLIVLYEDGPYFNDLCCFCVPLRPVSIELAHRLL